MDDPFIIVDPLSGSKLVINDKQKVVIESISEELKDYPYFLRKVNRSIDHEL